MGRDEALSVLSQHLDELQRLGLRDDTIVCRCEEVPASAILESRETMAGDDLRTQKGQNRAGMGWCQGTFCRPRVAAVMEQVLGHPVDPSTDVEHSGVNRIGKNAIVDYIKEHGGELKAAGDYKVTE